MCDLFAEYKRTKQFKRELNASKADLMDPTMSGVRGVVTRQRRKQLQIIPTTTPACDTLTKESDSSLEITDSADTR